VTQPVSLVLGNHARSASRNVRAYSGVLLARCGILFYKRDSCSWIIVYSTFYSSLLLQNLPRHKPGQKTYKTLKKVPIPTMVFLLLLKTRIRPQSGFDRDKRPRSDFKFGKSRSARPHSASPDRQCQSRHDPIGSSACSNFRIGRFEKNILDAGGSGTGVGRKMGKGVGRGHRRASSGVP